MIARFFKFIPLLWYADEHGWPEDKAERGKHMRQFEIEHNGVVAVEAAEQYRGALDAINRATDAEIAAAVAAFKRSPPDMTTAIRAALEAGYRVRGAL